MCAGRVTPGPPRLAGKDDDRRRDWLDRRRFYIDAVVTLAVATGVHYDGFLARCVATIVAAVDRGQQIARNPRSREDDFARDPQRACSPPPGATPLGLQSQVRSSGSPPSLGLAGKTHRLYHEAYLPLPPCALRRYLSPMLTHIVCSSCGHAGATDSARLPRILTCARCGHRALFEAKPSKRLTQGQRRHTAKRGRLSGQAHEIGRLVRSQVPA